MLLNCQHCGYTWDYQGENKYYATCPRCRYKVRIPGDKVHLLRRSRISGESSTKLVEKQPVKLLGIAGIVNKVIWEFNYDESMLIQILLRLQKSFGWLPRDMLNEVSKQLDIPLNQVYQVATFYKAFSLYPRGRHVIRVCMGTSCNVRGAPIILDKLRRLLGIEKDETTPDGRFTLETVNCLGCCALGPVMTVDGKYYGKLRPHEIEKLLSKYD
jgi:NADH-quinone oxidoreductase subunit E